MAQRLIIVITVILAWIGTAAASDMQPAELPPADFTAGQYIDSRGCVFMRDRDQGWVPRLYRGEELFCGFPPTLSGLSVNAEKGEEDSRVEESSSKALERSLAEMVFPNLNEGERVTDSAPFRPLPDMGPEPVETGPVDLLHAEIAAQSEIRYAMAGARQPNRELCRWLGYDGQPLPKGTGDAGWTHDPTQGFCGGLAPAQLSQLAFVRPAKMPEGVKDDREGAEMKNEGADQASQLEDKEGGAVTKSPAHSLSAAGGQAASMPSKNHGAQKSLGPVGRKKRETAADETIIPAHARYVLVGIYSDSFEVEKVAQRLLGLGLPAVRQVRPAQQGKVLILSGPFASRQAIVIALSRIKAAGFTDAVPR